MAIQQSSIFSSNVASTSHKDNPIDIIFSIGRLNEMAPEWIFDTGSTCRLQPLLSASETWGFKSERESKEFVKVSFYDGIASIELFFKVVLGKTVWGFWATDEQLTQIEFDGKIQLLNPRTTYNAPGNHILIFEDKETAAIYKLKS